MLDFKVTAINRLSPSSFCVLSSSIKVKFRDLPRHVRSFKRLLVYQKSPFPFHLHIGFCDPDLCCRLPIFHGLFLKFTWEQDSISKQSFSREIDKGIGITFGDFFPLNCLIAVLCRNFQ